MNTTITEEHNYNFFSGVYSDVWRQMIQPALTQAEADFIEAKCSLQPGSAVVDLMCGYGRHTLELARRGYNVTAIDSAEGYIAEVQQTAAAENLSVTATVGDASNTNFHQAYDAAICMGNSFAFFNESSVLRLLNNLSKALTPGGVFIINTWMIGEIAFRHFQEKVWQQVGAYKYLIDSSYHQNPTRIEAEHVVITPDGKAESIFGVDYIFTLAELQKLLEQCNFRLQDVFYTPRGRRFQLGDNKAYIVAVRNS